MVVSEKKHVVFITFLEEGGQYPKVICNPSLMCSLKMANFDPSGLIFNILNRSTFKVTDNYLKS